MEKVGGFWNAWKWRFHNWHLVEPSRYNCEQLRDNGYDGSYSRNAVGNKSGEKLRLQKYWGDGDNDTLSGNFGTIGFINDSNGHGWKGEWETDRFGRQMDKPIDFNNHLIDAARYVAMMKLTHKAQNKGTYAISIGNYRY